MTRSYSALCNVKRELLRRAEFGPLRKKQRQLLSRAERRMNSMNLKAMPQGTRIQRAMKRMEMRWIRQNRLA